MTLESTDEDILLDLQRIYLSQFVDTNIVTRFLPPEMRSAFKAVLHAMSEPGCLVRVTFTDASQISSTVRTIIAVCERRGLLDAEKSMVKPGCGPITIELNNGSGIELVLEATLVGGQGHHQGTPVHSRTSPGGLKG